MLGWNYDKAEMARRLEADMANELARAEAESVDEEAELVKAFDDPMSVGVLKARHRAARPHHTNEERLAYYRTRGLDRCDDYPGGDAKFEADVLSGKFHDDDGDMAEPPVEDAYIISKMLDGTFLFEESFLAYGYNCAVSRAYMKTWKDLGVAFLERK